MPQIINFKDFRFPNNATYILGAGFSAPFNVPLSNPLLGKAISFFKAHLGKGDFFEHYDWDNNEIENFENDVKHLFNKWDDPSTSVGFEEQINRIALNYFNYSDQPKKIIELSGDQETHFHIPILMRHYLRVTALYLLHLCSTIQSDFPTEFSKLKQLISIMGASSNVISLNYDTIFEQALHELFPNNYSSATYCFASANAPILLKLHGSCALWAQNRLNSEWQIQKAFFDPSKNPNPGIPDYSYKNPTLVDDTVLKLIKSKIHVPKLILPTTRKIFSDVGLQDTQLTLWGSIPLKPNLVIIGCSMAESEEALYGKLINCAAGKDFIKSSFIIDKHNGKEIAERLYKVSGIKADVVLEYWQDLL